MHDIDITRIDLNLLKVFTSLFETRSVSATAEQLGLAQSSVSHALRRLRDSVGDPLYVKTAAGMQPTPYAQKLAEPIGDALEALQLAFRNEEQFDPARSTKSFNLVMTDACEMIFLPKLTGHLRKIAPGIQLIVHQMPRSAYRSALNEGIVDLALGQMPSGYTDFYQQHLFDEHFTCVMRPGNPAQTGLSLKKFLQAEHAVIGPPATGEALIRRALGAKASKRRIVLQVPHYLSVPIILAETNLVAVMGKLIAAEYVRQGILAETPLPFFVEPVVTRQFWHERTHLDASNKWLRGVISGLFQ